MHPITIEIRHAIVLITMENKRKIKKLAVLRLDLSVLLKKVCTDILVLYKVISIFLPPN